MPLGFAVGSCVLLVLAVLAARGADQEAVMIGAAYSRQSKFGLGMEMVGVGGGRRGGQQREGPEGGTSGAACEGAPGVAMATIAE